MRRPAWWTNKPSQKKVRAALALYSPTITKTDVTKALPEKPRQKKVSKTP